MAKITVPGKVTFHATGANKKNTSGKMIIPKDMLRALDIRKGEGVEKDLHNNVSITFDENQIIIKKISYEEALKLKKS